jgi:hypothetical protein
MISNLFHGLLRGLAGGFVGAILGHVFVTWCLHMGGEFWLKGPYGPGQFFGISAYLGILYGCIGLALTWSAVPGLLGLLGNFIGIAFPMFVLTHHPLPMRVFMGLLAHFPAFTARLMMSMGGIDLVGMAWTLAVIAIYIVANWGTTLALGAILCPKRRWFGASAAVLGSFAGYLILKVFLAVVPSYAQGHWDPMSFMPSPMDLLTGLLIGAGIGAGVFLVGARTSDSDPAPEAGLH